MYSESNKYLEIIKNHAPGLVGEKNIFHGAVCIPLIKNGEDFDILFEVRSEKIPDQPGDICLPGGGIEKGETPKEAAVRESCEELLISENQLEIIGEADVFHTEHVIIYPYVGILSDYKNTFSDDEVGEVFRVPLKFFMETEPERFDVKTMLKPADNFPYDRISGGRNYQWRERTSTQFFYLYDNKNIWGLTAKIITAFCDTLKGI